MSLLSTAENGNDNHNNNNNNNHININNNKPTTTMTTTTATTTDAEINGVAVATTSVDEPVSSDSNKTLLSIQRQPFPNHLLVYDFYNGVAIRLDKAISTSPSSSSGLSASSSSSSGTSSTSSLAAAKVKVQETLPWELNQNENTTTFRQCLEDALTIWQLEQRKGIWIHVPTQLSYVVPDCIDLGFSFHSVPETNVLLLSRWLPVDSPSRLPFGPTHQVGVGIFVTSSTSSLSSSPPQNNNYHPINSTTTINININNNNNNSPIKMLVVRERTGPAAARQLWKMPTGLLDPGEEIGPAAVRELQEETGLQGIFQGIVCFRHAPNVASGRSISDLFFVCRVQLVPPPSSQQQQQQQQQVPPTNNNNNNNNNSNNDLDDNKEDFHDIPSINHDNDYYYSNKYLRDMLANRTQLQKEEIADICWMTIEEYAAQEAWQASPVYRELNQVLLDSVQQQQQQQQQQQRMDTTNTYLNDEVENVQNDHANDDTCSTLLRPYSLPIGFAPGTNTLYKSSSSNKGTSSSNSDSNSSSTRPVSKL